MVDSTAPTLAPPEVTAQQAAFLASNADDLEPDAWRITDGEGGYNYRDELPEEFSVNWSSRYGLKYEKLYSEATVAAFLKDAERYRWLRATTNFVTSKGERIDVRENPALWDSAIDGAIAALKAQK